MRHLKGLIAAFLALFIAMRLSTPEEGSPRSALHLLICFLSVPLAYGYALRYGLVLLETLALPFAALVAARVRDDATDWGDNDSRYSTFVILVYLLFIVKPLWIFWCRAQGRAIPWKKIERTTWALVVALLVVIWCFCTIWPKPILWVYLGFLSTFLAAPMLILGWLDRREGRTQPMRNRFSRGLRRRVQALCSVHGLPVLIRLLRGLTCGFYAAAGCPKASRKTDPKSHQRRG